jgi:hypothetical protein
MRRSVVFIFLFLATFTKAQDFTWWNTIHHWDGITPWNQYMTISPALMGPNALPVPELKNGLVDSSASLRIAFDHYDGKGDQTNNVFLRGILPLFLHRMSVELEVVPIEWNEMDTVTRDRRAVRTQSGKGSAGGDIYLATTLQLLKNKRCLPDMQLRMALKSASGTMLRDARYTDAPGYYFDLSFGKDFFQSPSFIQNLRWYADAGFYTYQTYDLQNLQNDCFFFGGGLSTQTKWFSLRTELAGYSGYLKNGDQPLLFRSEWRWKRPVTDFAISWQKGLHDYNYDLYRISCIIHFPADKLFPN